MQLNTIGYEGATIEQVIATLVKNDVQILVDIREFPVSRKPGFSKTVLAEEIGKHGLEYIHLGALGSPREIRHDFRLDRDWERFSNRYNSYLDTQIPAISELIEIINSKQCCLMCFEKDHRYCHRSFITQRLKQSSNIDLLIINLEAIDSVEAAYFL